MYKSTSLFYTTFIFLTVFFISSCTQQKTNENAVNTPSAPAEKFIPSINYTVTATFPHDTTSFTEGFVFYKQQLFESSGSPESTNARSIFGQVDLQTGKIQVKAELDRNQFFGEGITFLNDKVYMLTYKNKLGFIYDAKTFQQLGRFSFSNEEGWGLTTDGQLLIMSDGTNVLTYIDPKTLKPVKTLNVRNAGYAEDNLNELEFINGYIYANIWTKNYIVKIDTASGDVVGVLDLSMLVNQAKNKYRGSEVINGIAYDSISNKIMVTGKFWPFIYEINFEH